MDSHKSCLSIVCIALRLARSSQTKCDNESCFSMHAAEILLIVRLLSKASNAPVAPLVLYGVISGGDYLP